LALVHGTEAAYNLLLATLGGIDLDRYSVAFTAGTDDLGVELELDTLLGQDLLEGFAALSACKQD
jgi:hypothetical protein